MERTLSGVLWAKTAPYKALVHHMVDVGACAQALLETRPFRGTLRSISHALRVSEQDAIRLVGYLASLHDIGKAHPRFQASADTLEASVARLRTAGLFDGLSSAKSMPFRHEKHSEEIAARLLYERGVDEPLADALAAILRLHHQGKRGNSEPLPRVRSAQWMDMQSELEQAMYELFRPPLADLCSGAINNAVGMELMGIVILADWIASAEHIGALEPHPDLSEYVKRASAATAGALHNYGLAHDAGMEPASDLTALFPFIRRDQLRGLQRDCEAMADRPPNLAIIEAPMGEGKTEAALFLASRMMAAFDKSGFYVALPTAATSNQMYRRVAEMLAWRRVAGVRLLHGMAWLVDEASAHVPSGEEAEQIGRWLMPLRRAMLAQYGVGTVDQVMMAAMRIRYGVLRLSGLASKVLVIDEVHAYDTYMCQIIEDLLSWCRALNVPVVLLSATLPLAKKRRYLRAYTGNEPEALQMGYPLITEAWADGQLRQQEVCEVHMRRAFHIETHACLADAEQTARLASGLVEGGGRVCVLLNTVKQAQCVYRLLRDMALPGVELLLYHARFPARARKRLETACESRFGKGSEQDVRKRTILVCTQVCEQSLDVSFDAMITEIAPIDLLLQRAGRVHRHDGPHPQGLSEPTLHVLVPDAAERFGVTERIYAPLYLKRTLAYLAGRERIEVPSQMREAIEAVYTDKPEDERMLDDWARQHFADRQNQAQAQGATLDSPDAPRFFAVEQAHTLFDEDAGDMLDQHVRTRIGSDSRRIAMIPQALCERVAGPMQDHDAVRAVLAQSVCIPNYGLGDPPGDAIPGERLLKGCLLLPTEDGRFRWGKYLLRNDEELGILIDEEG